MSLDLAALLASKRQHRSRLGALPIGEKLRLLDALRERTLTIRRAALATQREGGSNAKAPAPDSTSRRDSGR